MSDSKRNTLLRAQEERDKLKAAGAPKEVIDAADQIIAAVGYGGKAPTWALKAVLDYASRGQRVNRYGRAA